jgi:hypothetical protein
LAVTLKKKSLKFSPNEASDQSCLERARSPETKRKNTCCLKNYLGTPWYEFDNLTDLMYFAVKKQRTSFSKK